jgi:hypothetical protein
MPGVRGTSGGRDGAEEKMAPWAPGLMPKPGSSGHRAADHPTATSGTYTCRDDKFDGLLR